VLGQSQLPLSVYLTDWTVCGSSDSNRISTQNHADIAAARRLRRPRDQYRYVTERWLLRQLLGQALGADPTILQFTAGTNGRPRLAADHRSDLDFNVSHSGRFLAIAIGQGCVVGIDIEERPAWILDSVSDIGRVLFSKRESLEFNGVKGDSVLALLRCWVRKEACLKAWGIGVNIRLQTLNVGVTPLPCAVEIPPLSRGYAALNLSDLELPEGLVGALATTRRCDSPVSFRWI
jgi:4'-phosphopantetheinyl transferase